MVDDLVLHKLRAVFSNPKAEALGLRVTSIEAQRGNRFLFQMSNGTKTTAVLEETDDAIKIQFDGRQEVISIPKAELLGKPN